MPGLGARLGLVTALLLAPTLVDTVLAAPPPTPLLWERQYVDETPLSPEEAARQLWQTCTEAHELGLRQNAVPGLRIGVLGDSTENQAANAALADPAFHWMYNTHCGEKYGSAIGSGRVAQLMTQSPDVVVIAMGHNDLTDYFQLRPDYLPQAIADLGRLLDATEAAPCRVLVNVPRSPPTAMTAQEQAAWPGVVGWLNLAMAMAESRPGVHVADWASRIEPATGHFVADGQHLTQAGINARINLTIATARQCSAPDTPIGLDAAPTSGAATLWWQPLPPPERITSYTVEVSDGRTFTTAQPTLTVAGLTDGVAHQFRVRATNGAGTGDPSPWSAPFTPTSAGARFTPLDPVRALDTRDGTGGKFGPFGPGETAALDLSGVVPAGASSVVLNLTASGQTAPTFVTAWPGEQPRPLASNLNPRPGVAAVPAMVATRVSADRVVRLYNNSGHVHLIADVIGYYGAPGDPTGALYVPVAPTRLLDTRDDTGPKTTPFGNADTLTLPVAGVPADASGVVVNLTSTDTTRPGFVTVWPAGRPRPVASNLNPHPGLTRANLTTVGLGTGPAITLYNQSASTELVVDLIGYYTAPGNLHGGSTYFAVTPERHLDTRDGTGGTTGPIPNTTDLALTFAGKGSVPPVGATAVDANITVTAPTGGGHTTLWPAGPRPTASNLNFAPGETTANRDLITLANGSAHIWSASATIHYVIDVTGWFGPAL